jgi:hypothetical protein
MVITNTLYKEFSKMKKTILATVLALGMATGTVMAQDHMNRTDYQDMQPGQGMMMNGQDYGTMMNDGGRGQGRMDGYGTMMNGRGMGPGMMGGHGMMMQGRAGCMNMMGQGMGQGMMGGGMMYNMSADNQQKFMNDTKEMRQKMHTMRFEYMEAMRNPKTTLKDLGDMEQKMLDMRKDMLKKAEKYQGMKK